MPFNLGERNLTINVKNKNIEHPENTTFMVKDYKGEDLYKGTYYLPDIRKVGEKDNINLHFNNLHCDYFLTLKINPNNYNNNIDIDYGLGSNLKCLIQVKPESIKKEMKISIKPKSEPIQNISLNDLGSQHYIAIFFLGLFLTIGIAISIINKKGILLHGKK